MDLHSSGLPSNRSVFAALCPPGLHLFLGGILDPGLCPLVPWALGPVLTELLPALPGTRSSPIRTLAKGAWCTLPWVQILC